MTTELEKFLVHPTTGELIARDELEKVAGAIESARMMKRFLDDALTELTEVLADHSRKIGTKTFSLEGLTVVVSPDKQLAWDVDYLDTALTEAGLPEDRIRELIVATVTYKVNASVAKQLAAANPEYAAIIEKAKNWEPKRQYVSLKEV